MAKYHEKPSTVEAVSYALVAAIERDICDRRGLAQEWEGIDDATKDEIRDAWAKIVQYHLDARDRQASHEPAE